MTELRLEELKHLLGRHLKLTVEECVSLVDGATSATIGLAFDDEDVPFTTATIYLSDD